MAAATSATLASDQNQRSDPTGSIGMVGGADFNFDDDIDPGLMGSPSISETGSQAGVTSLAHQGSISNASDLLMHQGLRQHAAANQQLQQSAGQLGMGNGFGQDPGGANAEDRKVSTSDIQLVQNLIERCMQLYMSQAEVVVSLEEQASIERGFTALVWQKLEEQNEDFFRAYYTRLKLKDQIVLFNHLLEQQVQMVHRIRASAAWMAPNGMHMMGPRPGMMIPGMPIIGQPPAQGSLSMGAMMNPGMLLPSHQQPLTIAPLPGNQGPHQQGGVPGMHMSFMPDGSQPLTSLPQPSDPFTSPLLSGAPPSLPGNQQGFPVASGALPASGSMGVLQPGEGLVPEAGAQGLGAPTSNAAQQQQDPAGDPTLGAHRAGSHGALSEFAHSLSLGMSMPSPGLEGPAGTGELLGMPTHLHPSTGDLAAMLPNLSPARGMPGAPGGAGAAAQAHDNAGDLTNIPRNFSLSDLGIGLDHDADQLGFGGLMHSGGHGDGHAGTHDLPHTFSLSELAALGEDDEQGES